PPAPPPTTGGPADPPGQLADRALSLYESAQEKLRAGDWAGYGNLMQQLRDVLNQLAGSPESGATAPRLPQP
ncbi:MAG: hypothetical protein ACM3XN_00425, partial [Chloroflexota bacterium]